MKASWRNDAFYMEWDKIGNNNGTDIIIKI